MFKQLRVIDTRRAGGLAREATEAKIHFVAKHLGRLELPISDGPHQRDPAARAVALHLGVIVSRAGRQAQPAVHALLHDGIIEVFQMRVARGVRHSTVLDFVTMKSTAEIQERGLQSASTQNVREAKNREFLRASIGTTSSPWPRISQSQPYDQF